MTATHNKGLKTTHLYLVAILIVASVATLLSTYVIYRNSLRAAEESLKLQALGIAASLEPSLRERDGNKNIFRDIVTDASWEGIAFIALYDRNGLTLLHSNENLVGRQITSPEIGLSARQGKAVFGPVRLGTGEEVFVLNYPLRESDSIKVLRIALHPYPAQHIIRQARLQAISILITIGILWIIGLFFIKAVKRSERLAAMMAERERLAVIGEMAAVLAHEIRNPLGSIKGFAQYLTEKGREDKESLDIIIDEAKRLEHLTEDLLLYARPSEVRTDEFSLSALAREVVQVLQESAGMRETTKTIRTAISGEIIIQSDREKMKQILSNILQNAVEAVDGKGLIEVRAEQSGDRTVIAVSDNGCGMDQETQGKVFDSFFTTKAKGTGLGLAIVERLTKTLGGEIGIESAPGRGTVFTVTLPSTVRKGDHE